MVALKTTHQTWRNPSNMGSASGKMNKFVLPNLGSFNKRIGRKHRRGDIKTRYYKMLSLNRMIEKNDFYFIEIPGDFIKKGKNKTITEIQGVSDGTLLTKDYASYLYSSEGSTLPEYKYIIHSDPGFGDHLLNWHDPDWVRLFIDHISAISSIFGIERLFGIEIHPGISNGKKNNIDVFTNAIIKIKDTFPFQKILIENRNETNGEKHIVSNGNEINQCWSSIIRKGIKDTGFMVDVEQLLSACIKQKLDFINEVQMVHHESIFGFHIHSLIAKRAHQPPKINEDEIEKKWSPIKEKIRKIDKELVVLPEIFAGLEHIKNTYHFCKQKLEL